MSTEIEIALQYVEYLRTGDEKIRESAFVPDFHDHVSGQRGTEILPVVRRWITESFADTTYEVHGVTTGDGLVMVWFSSRGRHVGNAFPQLAGREPTGREINAEAVHTKTRECRGRLEPAAPLTSQPGQEMPTAITRPSATCAEATTTLAGSNFSLSIIEPTSIRVAHSSSRTAITCTAIPSRP